VRSARREANTVLTAYIPVFNGRLPGLQRRPQCHRPPPAALDAICSFTTAQRRGDEHRVDNVPRSRRLSRIRLARVQLQERLDGRMLVFYQAWQIAEQEMPEDAPETAPRQRGFEPARPDRGAAPPPSVAAPGPWTPPPNYRGATAATAGGDRFTAHVAGRSH
jgi:hypothetical protein